jgi:RimJ/RimL family protein N-acetyltransferase
MTEHYNHLNQPIGFPVPEWTPPPFPPDEPMSGRYCRVERLAPERHAAELFKANITDSEGHNWNYLPYGPFDSLVQYRKWLDATCCNSDPLFHAILDQMTGKAVGVASYLRITPEQGTIEVGHINYSPRLQRKPAATEAMFLMMQRAFALGYRRYEWKCDALNAPSRKAAQRLGLSYEGVFRQAVIYKQRNRDTAWYAAIDQEWPQLKGAFTHWLDPANFDENGQQRVPLSSLTAPILNTTE